MISYEPLWDTMKKKGITQYALINKYQFSKGTLDSLKKNKAIKTTTLDTLCTILSCNVEDVLCYVPEKE